MLRFIQGLEADKIYKPQKHQKRANFIHYNGKYSFETLESIKHESIKTSKVIQAISFLNTIAAN